MTIKFWRSRPSKRHGATETCSSEAPRSHSVPKSSEIARASDERSGKGNGIPGGGDSDAPCSGSGLPDAGIFPAASTERGGAPVKQGAAHFSALHRSDLPERSTEKPRCDDSETKGHRALPHPGQLAAGLAVGARDVGGSIGDIPTGGQSSSARGESGLGPATGSRPEEMVETLEIRGARDRGRSKDRERERRRRRRQTPRQCSEGTEERQRKRQEGGQERRVSMVSDLPPLRLEVLERAVHSEGIESGDREELLAAFQLPKMQELFKVVIESYVGEDVRKEAETEFASVLIDGLGRTEAEKFQAVQQHFKPLWLDEVPAMIPGCEPAEAPEPPHHHGDVDPQGAGVILDKHKNCEFHEWTEERTGATESACPILKRAHTSQC